MKIDDKEIDKLLESFEAEEIEVPEQLDDKLNEKLLDLKPKKSKKILKSLIASILVMLISYHSIPSFKTFADNVFKYIFGDVGVENAINHGYITQDNQAISIGEYEIDIENIYMDNLRISFDAVIKNIKDIPKDEFGEDSEQYSLYAQTDKVYSMAVDNGLFQEDDKNIFKTNVQIIGDGVEELIKVDKDKLTLDLELVRHYNEQVNGEYELKDEVIGKQNLILDIPKNLEYSNVVQINQTIKDDRVNLDIQRLEISPTMMYLDTKGTIDNDIELTGIYNFKITSENGAIYKENLTLSARGKENGVWSQTIVPSIYYDDSKNFKLKADGVFVSPVKDINIDLSDNYPMKIDYFDNDITIKDVYYKENQLTIEILNDKGIEHLGTSKLDGEYGVSSFKEGDELYGYVFETPKKDNYNFSLNMVMKYEVPIEVDINIK